MVGENMANEVIAVQGNGILGMVGLGGVIQ